VEAPSADERTGGDPAALVQENARRKARDVHARLARARPDGPLPRVLGVDTEVVLSGRALGKPDGEAAARALLEALSGREHDVMSGLVLIDGAAEHARVAVTEVRFRALDGWLLDWYLETGEWRERAGGYAIQGRGAALVESIQGDYLNVVGLPLGALLDVAPAVLTA
jgi:septum formation protein